MILQRFFYLFIFFLRFSMPADAFQLLKGWASFFYDFWIISRLRLLLLLLLLCVKSSRLRGQIPALLHWTEFVVKSVGCRPLSRQNGLAARSNPEVKPDCIFKSVALNCWCWSSSFSPSNATDAVALESTWTGSEFVECWNSIDYSICMFWNSMFQPTKEIINWSDYQLIFFFFLGGGGQQEMGLIWPVMDQIGHWLIHSVARFSVRCLPSFTCWSFFRRMSGIAAITNRYVRIHCTLDSAAHFRYEWFPSPLLDFIRLLLLFFFIFYLLSCFFFPFFVFTSDNWDTVTWLNVVDVVEVVSIVTALYLILGFILVVCYPLDLACLVCFLSAFHYVQS